MSYLGVNAAPQVLLVSVLRADGKWVKDAIGDSCGDGEKQVGLGNV